MIRPPRSVVSRFILRSALLAMLGALAGCEVVGYPIQVIAGPAKIPAVYELADRPTVILVDDPVGKLPERALANLLADRIGNRLLKARALEQVIPPTLVQQLRQDEPDFGNWAIDRVGRTVGAEQVVYVLIQDFQLTEEQLVMRPTIAMRIKVVDVSSGRRLFPVNDQMGYAIGHELVYEAMSDAPATAKQLLARRLIEEAGQRVAKLFYDHKAPEPGEGLPG
jgi:hypothetical protein